MNYKTKKPDEIAADLTDVVSLKGGIMLNRHGYCMFVTNMDDDPENYWFQVQLKTEESSVIIITQGYSSKEALDNAVNFAINNDIDFIWSDLYEAKDCGVYDTNNNIVEGTYCVGDTGIYISTDTTYITQYMNFGD